jgi:hypothetical protein
LIRLHTHLPQHWGCVGIMLVTSHRMSRMRMQMRRGRISEMRNPNAKPNATRCVNISLLNLERVQHVLHSVSTLRRAHRRHRSSFCSIFAPIPPTTWSAWERCWRIRKYPHAQCDRQMEAKVWYVTPLTIIHASDDMYTYS